MDHVLNWVWQGCSIALATLVILRVLGRSRAQARYALCWVALIAVLVLPLSSSWLGDVSAEQPASLTSGPLGPILSIPSVWWTSSAIALCLCILWSGIYTLRLAVALRAARRARRGCLPFPSSVESELHYWNAVRAQGRRARLVLSSDVRSAAVLGCGSPIIAIAPALLEHLSLEEVDRVIIHEWAHVQRHDDVVNLAHSAARALAGWHPAVWWLERQLQIEREAACDEIAVVHTGCPKRYAACLTTIAALVAPTRLQLLPTLGALSSPMLSKRVIRILSHRHLASPKRSTLSTVLATVVLGTLFTALGPHRLIQSAAPLAAIERVRSATMPGIELSRPLVTDVASGLSRKPRGEPHGQQRASVPDRSSASPSSRPPVRENPATADFEALPTSQAPQTAVSADAVRPEEQAESAHSASTSSLAPVDESPPSGTTPLQAPAVAEQSGKPQPVSPWAAATDAGLAIGRTSQKAGVATSSFFTRFGKTIARSF